MVNTRRQQQMLDQGEQKSEQSKRLEQRPRTVSHEDAAKPSPKKKQKTQDAEAKKEQAPSASSSSTTSGPKARCPDNQPLLDALQELEDAISSAQTANPKLRFQAANLRKVIKTLSSFDEKITSGKRLASGKDKVDGLGPATAFYIDDFLREGKISAVDKFKTARKEYENDDDRNHIIQINRAPILTLWATIVSERQGYTHEEAVTHGKWISFIMARSKGKSLGKWDESRESSSKKDDRKEDTPKEHVFGHIKVPVKSTEKGQRMALMGEAIVPEKVDQYLHNALGGDFERTRSALQGLADSMDPEALRDKAYDLYEQLRPEWQGWAKPGKFDLNKVKELDQSSEG